MAKVGKNLAKKLTSTGNFFNIPNDGDTARVRFLYKSIDDLLMYDLLHDIGSERRSNFVDCLCTPEGDISGCPFCRAGLKRTAKLFIHVYNLDILQCQVWQRGQAFETTLRSNLSDLRGKDMFNYPVNIERFGDKGDTETTYKLTPEEESAVNIEDFEPVDLYGDVITKLSAEEMNNYLETGELPDSGKKEARRQLGVKQNKVEESAVKSRVNRRVKTTDVF